MALGNAGKGTRFKDVNPRQESKKNNETKPKQRNFYLEDETYERFEDYVLVQKRKRKGEFINNSVIMRELLNDFLTEEGF